MKKAAIFLALALGASALTVNAQDAGGPPPDGRGGPGMNGRRPPPPLMQALDVNHDGVIDADEIANAPAALKMLDANGDGKLTRDELRPPRPSQDGGPESGYGRPPGPPPGQ